MTVNEYKIKKMLQHGFESSWCVHRKTTIYTYESYEWTIEDIKKTSTPLILKYIDFYDGKISEDELDQEIEKERFEATINTPQ